MTFDDERDIDPDLVKARVEFEEADLQAAFKDDSHETQELFYKLYGPGWNAEPISEKLSILADVALRAEEAKNDAASALNLSASPAEPKNA